MREKRDAVDVLGLGLGLGHGAWDIPLRRLLLPTSSHIAKENIIYVNDVALVGSRAALRGYYILDVPK